MNSPRIDFLSDYINPFDNADMQFFQRSENTIVVATTSEVHSADRFKTNVNGVFSWDEQNAEGDRPTPFNTGGKLQFALRRSVLLRPTATQTPTGAQFVTHSQFFEAQRMEWLMYRRMKFGFMVKGNKTGTYTLCMLGQSTDQKYIVPWTLEQADTWEFKTFEIDMSGYFAFNTFTPNNNQGLVFVNVLTSGPDITGVSPTNQWISEAAISGSSIRAASGQVNFFDNTLNRIQFTGFRAMPLDYAGQEVDLWKLKVRSHEVELQNCQRYFQKSYTISDTPGAGGFPAAAESYVAPSNFWRHKVNFATPMKSPPAVTIYNPSTGLTGTSIRDNGANTATMGSISAGTNGFHVQGADHLANVEYRFHWTADSDF